MGNCGRALNASARDDYFFVRTRQGNHGVGSYMKADRVDAYGTDAGC